MKMFKELIKKFKPFTLIAAMFVLFQLTGLYAREEIGDEIRMYAGESKIMEVNNPTRIVIGNPNVADVISVTKSEITLGAKGAGATTLVFWDGYGEQSFKIRVLSEDLSDTKASIDDLLQKLGYDQVYTQIQDIEGKVALLGRVKTIADQDRILSALGSLKDKIQDLLLVQEEDAVVEIDVQVLELNRDSSTKLGLSWPNTISLSEIGSPGISDAGSKWSTLFKVSTLQRQAFGWTLDALVASGKAKILSRPRLACQSGKEAELLVGGEKPTFSTTVAGTSGATGTNIEYKEFGIKLKIKPTVTDEDRIKVGLSVEVSEVGAAEVIGEFNAQGQATKTTAKAYPLSKRTAATELFLSDGQTLAIGGLMKQKTEENYTEVPGFGRLPIIGALFRHKELLKGGGSGEKGDTELFIVLTPSIVSRSGSFSSGRKDVCEAASLEVPASLDLPYPLRNYVETVKKLIVSGLQYPSRAKEAGFEGTVKLSLRLAQSGHLLDATVKDSSGYKILDDSALNIAKKITYYPPFPSSVTESELWIDIPVEYRINN